MNFWVLATNYVIPCKTHGYGLLSYNVLILYVWHFGILDELCLRNQRPIEWMECDFNLLCYGLFKIPKIIIILKAFLSIFLNYF
jgi:hypothetical protein